MARLCVLLAALMAAPGAAHGQACEPATWVRLEGAVAAAPAREVLAEMAKRDVVLLGETHDEPDDHRWQLHTLAALYVLRPDMAIGFEALPRAAQPALERWVRGELAFEQLLEQAKWREVWNVDPELYRPLLEFARLHAVPALALNVGKAERATLSRPAPPPPAYLEVLRRAFRAHRGGNRREGGAEDEKAFEAFVRAQQGWDRAFAEGLAARAGRGGKGTLAVGIIGSGHLRDGHGVALQLRDLGIERVGTLLPLRAPEDCGELNPGLADAAFLLPPRPAGEKREQPGKPRLGVQLEPGDDGVRLVAVTEGSLAERAGLRKGDIVVSLAGRRLEPGAAGAARLVEAVREQPAGTWLPLQVRRGDEVVDIVVRFPAAE